MKEVIKLIYHLLSFQSAINAVTCVAVAKGSLTAAYGSTHSNSVGESSSRLTSLIVKKREKRHSEDGCVKPGADAVRRQFALEDDNNVNIKLFWVGKRFETQLLITTFDVRVFIFVHLRKKSKLYKSINDGITFNQMEGNVKDADIRTTFGVVKSDANPAKLILIGFSTSMHSPDTTLFITEDGTASWRSVTIPFRVRQDEPIIPHTKHENWLLALEDGGSRAVWLSKDFGMNWVKLMDNAYSVRWGADTGNPTDDKTIFVTVKHFLAGILVSPASSLWRSKDFGQHFEKLHDHIYSLGIQESFVFISIDFDESSKTRVMHVSKNNGDAFHRVRVPDVTPERFYAILDVSEGEIFLHVDEPEDTGKGTLFISDADGVLYSKSLENHFYTNDAVTDFYKVESMRGVFLTHQLQGDKTLQSVITFNRGATWTELFLTDDQCRGAKLKPNKRCSLHYHHTFSQLKGHFVQGPLSTPTAFGIIMLHGVSGDALHTNNTSVYLSRNGGYNWTKVLDGPHHYAIGDHGNLLVAIPRDLQSNKTDQMLQYSLDQGRCWHTMKFTDDPLLVRGLVTEPHSVKRSFSIWGVFENDNSKVWQVITVNFEKIFSRKCEKSEYEYWSPHEIGRKDGCYIGLKEKYPRVKKNTFCYSGEDYKPEIIKSHCECTFDDLECDYGYIKDAVGKCIRDNAIKLEICRNGDVEKLREGEGYRRVPGNQCKGGKESLVKRIIDYVDTKVPCKPSELDSYGFSAKVDHNSQQKAQVSKGLLAFGLIVIFIVMAGGFIFAYNKVIRYRNSNRSSYRYSQLSNAGDDDDDDDMLEEVNGYDPVRPCGNQYKDESDFESDAEMLKL